MTDIPLMQAAHDANKHVMEGHDVYQKFTCAHCGARQTMEVPNAFYMQGKCEECSKITTIVECGYALVMGGNNAS